MRYAIIYFDYGNLYDTTPVIVNSEQMAKQRLYELDGDATIHKGPGTLVSMIDFRDGTFASERCVAIPETHKHFNVFQLLTTLYDVWDDEDRREDFSWQLADALEVYNVDLRHTYPYE